jgi:hypothetical protein
MRYREGKVAIIVDHVGNVFEHGLPDEVREWTLESKKKKAENFERVKECPVCMYVMDRGVTICPGCGYEFEAEVSERSRLETEASAELNEVTAEEIKLAKLRKKPYGHYAKIKSFDEMKAFQEAKGYKFVWVLHKCYELGLPVPYKYNKLMERYVYDRDGFAEQHTQSAV